MRLHLHLLGLSMLAMGASGCGSSVAGLCDEFCDCEGCNDAEREECVDDGEDLQKLAEDEGCGDQADDLLSCYDDQIRCSASRVDLDGCETEERALGKCIGGGVVVVGGRIINGGGEPVDEGGNTSGP